MFELAEQFTSLVMHLNQEGLKSTTIFSFTKGRSRHTSTNNMLIVIIVLVIMNYNIIMIIIVIIMIIIVIIMIRITIIIKIGLLYLGSVRLKQNTVNVFCTMILNYFYFYYIRIIIFNIYKSNF